MGSGQSAWTPSEKSSWVESEAQESLKEMTWQLLSTVSKKRKKERKVRGKIACKTQMKNQDVSCHSWDDK